MTTSYARGHKIVYDGNNWYYADTMEIFDDSRPCNKCGRYPDSKGYDACLGYVKGATSACCGHGAEPGYVVRNGKRDVINEQG
jgi:hypothetical protein